MFKKVECEKCGGPVKGLQCTQEQRDWLDLIKDTALSHMQYVGEQEEELDLDTQGLLTLEQGFLFLYGYMTSREDTVQ